MVRAGRKNRFAAVYAPRGTLYEGISLTGQANPRFGPYPDGNTVFRCLENGGWHNLPNNPAGRGRGRVNFTGFRGDVRGVAFDPGRAGGQGQPRRAIKPGVDRPRDK